jgi:hypothetical protein
MDAVTAQSRRVSAALHELTARISPVLSRYGVLSAAVFGSFARGEAGPDSDVDLLVELPDTATLLTLSGLQIELARALGREVDVVTERGLKKLIRPHVLAEQVRIYG